MNVQRLNLVGGDGDALFLEDGEARGAYGYAVRVGGEIGEFVDAGAIGLAGERFLLRRESDDRGAHDRAAGWIRYLPA